MPGLRDSNPAVEAPSLHQSAKSVEYRHQFVAGSGKILAFAHVHTLGLLTLNLPCSLSYHREETSK